MKYLKILFLIIPTFIFSQETLNGIIEEENKTGKHIGVEGASVYWLNQSVGTTTSADGRFTIPYKSEYKKLIVSFIGFDNDTLTVNSPKEIHHVLSSTDDIEEVVVKSKKKAKAVSLYSAENIINVSSDELLKAACCNLSESFETNPSIDVNFADAVTGTRQIKMLGLTSPYILISTENVPSIRGASQAYGLSFTPGTWVESIQITKGSGSVVNGFESIAGQINVELQKPSRDDKLFVNAFGAMDGRLELNTHLNTKVNEKWHTGLYVHGNMRDKKSDKNNDNFLDMPLAKQFNIMNRWQYTNPEKGFVSFINFKYLNDQKQAGEIDFNPSTDKFTTNAWGSEINTERFDVSTKLGYVNPEIPYQSIGVQLAYSNHNQESYFGLNVYDIEQNSLYVNALYNSIIGDSRSKFKTGLSFTYDTYDEKVQATDYHRKENSVGAFFEYSYDNLGDLNLIAGIRIDQHNLLGTFVTPRLHVRYTPWGKSALKASFGRGKRSANIFAENQNLFASSRSFNILNSNGTVYGLNPEIAWNYGMSFTQKFKVFGRSGDITLDYYKTDFKNQVVVDIENPQEVNFYNLDGKSIADSFQAEVSYSPFQNFDVRLAYKYYNVKTQYLSGYLDKALTPKKPIFCKRFIRNAFGC